MVHDKRMRNAHMGLARTGKARNKKLMFFCWPEPSSVQWNHFFIAIMIDDDSLDPLCNLHDDIGFDPGDEGDTNANANARLLQQMEEDDISDEEYEEQLEEMLAYCTPSMKKWRLLRSEARNGHTKGSIRRIT